MNRSITIVMYHYVRDLQRSRYPALKGLPLDRFRSQLDYLCSRHTPVTVQDLLAALSDSGKDLPANAVLLTFDDGFIDHFTNVFPLLDDRSVQGCFFPPAQAILEHKVLDVHKIHFILAAGAAPRMLLDRVFGFLPEFSAAHNVRSREYYVGALSEVHRFDPPEVTLLKRLLQRELPPEVRSIIVSRLFAEYVTADEAGFAAELYMSPEQIQCMIRHGMHIGGHGHRHVWLNRISPAEQQEEIDRSLRFLDVLGAPRSEWTMCYPFGAYDQNVLDILRNRQCGLGFSVEPRVADLSRDSYLTLPRIDTNDLPV